jgi:hypothetical protein
MSFSVDVDEDGVSTGDWLASLEEPTDDGDEVPSLPSLFFLGLFGSLPRESYQKRHRVSTRTIKSSTRRSGTQGELTTLWLKRFIFVDNSFSPCGPVRDAQLGCRGRF